MISGVNLPAAQLQIAMGVPLNRIADIRALYALVRCHHFASMIDLSIIKPGITQTPLQDPLGTSQIDFDKPELRQPPNGHVIAARITAENPDEVL